MLTESEEKTLAMLTENVHFVFEDFHVGRWTGDRYCFDVIDGMARTMRITHPDITHDVIENHGNRLLMLRESRNKGMRHNGERAKRLESRRRKD